MSKFIKGLITLVVGATAGVVTGIMLAPRKGKETRQLIKDKATKASKNVTDEFEDKMDKIQDKFRGFKEKAQEEVDKAKEAISKK